MLSKKETGRIPPAKKLSKAQNTKQAIVHPLGQDKVYKTSFSALYAKGGIPCRLLHGSVKHKLNWTTPLAQLNYNPILITFFEGLQETAFPFVFVVKQGLKELLTAPDAAPKIKLVLSSCIPSLRSALSSKTIELYHTALESLETLAILMGSALTPHLGFLLPPLGSKVLGSDISLRERTYSVLATIEEFGGSDALKVIRSRIPTYTSMKI